MSDKPAKQLPGNQEKEMSFWDHLDVLRFSLMRSMIAIIIIAIGAFYFTSFIYDVVILGPMSPDFISNRLFCELSEMVNIPSLCINQNPVELNNFEMAGQFTSNLLIVFVAGLIIAMPYVLTELWLFVRPALTLKERAGTRGFVVVTTILFLIGISFGYFIVTPLAVNFLLNWSISPNIHNTIRLGSYIRTVVMTSLSAGIVFELPVLIYFMAKAGLVTKELLREYRKHAVVAFFILAAVITPPDMISQFLVAIPLISLYEVSIMITGRVERKRVQEL
ncbi:MAG: twin-arginine translocase subunit TatC [Bacteroidetes bacterium]|nr:MAG: twin-arginine translocase subunit TatC [Bacteroidota bacterium]